MKFSIKTETEETPDLIAAIASLPGNKKLVIKDLNDTPMKVRERIRHYLSRLHGKTFDSMYNKTDLTLTIRNVRAK